VTDTVVTTDTVTITLHKDARVVLLDAASITMTIATMKRQLLLLVSLDTLLVELGSAVVVAIMTETTTLTLLHLVAIASAASLESRKF